MLIVVNEPSAKLLIVSYLFIVTEHYFFFLLKAEGTMKI